MDTNNNTPRIFEKADTSATDGYVKWSPIKSIWFLSNLIVSFLGGFIFFTWDAFLVFIVFTLITLCFGHSLGMHRRLIHNSYDCPIWMEYLFVHLGVLVGMAGPFGMIKQHDMRDWAQRKNICHNYLRHGEGFWKDGWWQLNCDIELKNPPEFIPEDRIKNDRVYHFMEDTWMLQQIPWALILFYFGGISWVVWGVSARITVSTFGHWFIGYFAHNKGFKDWYVDGAAVQGHNVPYAAYITMGESWHNNHHAYPGSAMLGIYSNQPDPGWWVLNRLMNVGLVWNVKLPNDLPIRPELKSLKHNYQNNISLRTPIRCSLFNLLS